MYAMRGMGIMGPQVQCHDGSLADSYSLCPDYSSVPYPVGTLSPTDQLQLEVDALWNQVLGQQQTVPVAPSSFTTWINQNGTTVALLAGGFLLLMMAAKR